MSRLLLDTNVLLDCVDPNRAHHDDAMRLIARCNGGGDMGLASSHSFKDAYYIMSQLYGEKHAREAVRILSDLVVIGPIGAEETLVAIDSNEPDFEDGLIRACAERVKANFIISRDKDAFQKSSLKRLSARDYVELFCPRDETTLEGAEND